MSLEDQSRINKLLWWGAAFAVPLAYLVFYTPYGMDTTDFGYFYGYAWRILQGQMPYRDFSYIKPALPLYWHAFWLWLTPENLGILAGKAGFLATMLATSWCTAIYLGRIFSLSAMDLPLPLLATCGFVWGVHSFPHMPWHTADGVLFAGGALLAGAYSWPFLAGLLAGCAMLCKQSFLLVPFAVVAVAWLESSSWRKALRCGLGWLGALLSVWLFLRVGGAWEDFSRMTTGQLDIREALDAGIWIYLRQNWLFPILAIAPWLVARSLGKHLPGWLLPAYVYLTLLVVWYVQAVVIKQSWIGYGASWPTLFMLLGCICVIFPSFFLVRWLRCATGPLSWFRASVGLGAGLVVSWSVAISGGYKIPAFFAVPLLFSLFVVHARLGGKTRPLAWLALIAGLIMFGFGYQHPYVFPERPMPRASLMYDAGRIYPRASGVMVDSDMLARLAELKELRAKYGSAYKTLPGFSFAYYLNDDKPVYSSDWLIDWEINGEIDRLYRELLDKGLTVFMERDQMDAERADAYERAGYGVPQLVRRNWKIVEETPHFVVFQPPLEGDAAKNMKTDSNTNSAR